VAAYAQRKGDAVDRGLEGLQRARRRHFNHIETGETSIMALQKIPANAPLQQMLNALKADGGLIIEGMFTTELITTMHEALTAAAHAFTPGAATQGLGEDGKAFVGAQTIRFSSLGKITPAYFQMLDNPLYAALADAILLPH